MLLAMAGTLPLLWPGRSAGQGRNPAAGAAMAASAGPAGGTAGITATIVDWARGLRFEDIPAPVIHEARRYLLDAWGCTLAGWNTDKGRLAAGTMQAMAGTAGKAGEAALIGTRSRLPAPIAAFANAELMNALDYDAIPHVPPVTLPALLAVAQREKLSGRALLTGIVVAHEIAVRLSAASSQMISSLIETGETPTVFGINHEGIIAATAGIGAMLGYDAAKMAHAMGLAGYYCPPQGSHNWETLSPKTHVKYTPVGWICQGAVTAALLAGQGFTSNPALFDGPAAFPAFYGWPAWKPEVALAGYGENWRILSVDYKPHAACRFTHSQIDCMQRLVARHGLKAQDMEAIETLGVPFVANPDPLHVRTQEDGQFSTPYVVALAAHGIPLDAHAYDADRLHDPAIRATMARIRWAVHPDATAAKKQDRRSYIARVTVRMKNGQTFVEESLFPKGVGSLPDSRLSDAELEEKFLANATMRLPLAEARRLVAKLWQMDRLADVNEARG